MLARRFKKKDGSAPDIEMLTEALAEDTAADRLPASLVVTTVSAASLLAAGQAAAAGALSAKVAALTDGVLKAMLLSKLKGEGFPKGIYTLDGDDLKFNLDIGAKGRPTQFATRPGDGNYLAVLKRK